MGINDKYIVRITPEDARRLLDSSSGNRPIRNSDVDSYAEAMKYGEWKITHQGIAIGEDGSLKDGHHRLLACIKANTPFETEITYNLSPEAYPFIDVGIKRSFSDIMKQPKRLVEIYRLAAEITFNKNKLRLVHIESIAQSELAVKAKKLIEYCGTMRRFFSTASMKLAACITMIDGGNEDYVLSQYRALCLLDFESMSKASQSLIRQVNSTMSKSYDYREPLVRGFRVFDINKKHISKIQINEADVRESLQRVRNCCQRLLAGKTYH